jgi:hypothetical protein
MSFTIKYQTVINSINQNQGNELYCARVIVCKYKMGLMGKLGKVWEKIKNVGKKVWGGLKKFVNKALPIAKKIAPVIAERYAPGSGEAVKQGLSIADLAVYGNIGAALEQAKNINWKG